MRRQTRVLRAVLRSATANIALPATTYVLTLSTLFAQDAVFRAQTTLRQLEVRVLDNQDRALIGLTKESFTLSIDGKPIEIATFDFIGRPAEITSSEVARSTGKKARTIAARAAEVLRGDAGETRVLILPEVSRASATAVYESLRHFISEPWPAGTLVALEGTPFTRDREQLLKALDVKFGGGSLVDLGATGDQFSAEVMEDWKAELIRNGIDPAPYMPQTFGATLLRTKLRSYRYRDIVRQLSAFPGKKVVVLYREGLPMEPSSQAWWRELAAEAVRHRVSFYTVDSRGLLGSGAGANRQRPAAPPPIISASNTTEGRSLTLREASEGRILSQDDGRNGIRQLAATTGGQAAVNTNDLAQVFEDLRTDLSDYYLLGYYPDEDSRRRTPGKTHRIKVKVKRPRARVRTLAGYSDPKPFTEWAKSERFGHLYQAINGEAEYGDLKADVGFEIFADDYGGGRLYFDVGGALGDFESVRSKKRAARSFSVVVKLTGEADHQIAHYSGHEIRVESPGAQSQAANRSVPWHYSDVFEGLSVGDYLLRAVVRDDETGRIGSYDTRVRIPALAGEYSASTLFLTSRYGPVKQPESTTLLLAGGAGLAPMSRAACRRGQKLAIVFELYDVAPAQLERPPAVTALLTTHGEVQEPSITGQLTSDVRLKRLRFMGYLDSSGLEPGAYELKLAVIGQPGGTETRFLRRSFDVR